jgi:hypothetical protein
MVNVRHVSMELEYVQVQQLFNVKMDFIMIAKLIYAGLVLFLIVKVALLKHIVVFVNLVIS